MKQSICQLSEVCVLHRLNRQRGDMCSLKKKEVSEDKTKVKLIDTLKTWLKIMHSQAFIVGGWVGKKRKCSL